MSPWAGFPYDIGNVAAKIDGGPFAGFYLAAAVGLDRAYPEVDLRSALNDKGKAAAARIAGQCQVEWSAELAFHRMDDYTVEPNVIARPDFQQVIATNRLGRGLLPRRCSSTSR